MCLCRFKIFVCDLGGFGEADDGGDVFCAAAEVALLSAASYDGFYDDWFLFHSDVCAAHIFLLYVGFDIERADAFWSVDLMAAYRVKVDVCEINGDFAECLRSIGVENDVWVCFFYLFGEFFDWGDLSCLIIDVHD